MHVGICKVRVESVSIAFMVSFHPPQSLCFVLSLALFLFSNDLKTQFNAIVIGLYACLECPTANSQHNLYKAKKMPANIWLEWFLSSMGNLIWQSLYYCTALLWIGSDFTVRELNKSWTGCVDMRYNWKLYWCIDLWYLCGSFAKWALIGERKELRKRRRWKRREEGREEKKESLKDDEKNERKGELRKR